MIENKIENAIIIRSKTRLEQLTERFNTVAQAAFYVKQQKKSFSFKQAKKESIVQDLAEDSFDEAFSPYQIEHDKFYQALDRVQKEIQKLLKFKIIFQEHLPNYIFSKKDLVIVLGQDGLVANTAKYVHDIPIIAVNPDKERIDGILLPFNVSNFLASVQKVLSENYKHQSVTMAVAEMNDGQRLLAFNDFFVGPSNHTSARYNLSFKNRSENQSSSGIIISTGAGSTGWLSSLFNMANSIHKTFHGENEHPYRPFSREEKKLIFVVREPFLSKSSQINLTSGVLFNQEELIIESQMPKNGIIFSDGILSDYMSFNSGSIVSIRIADETAKLVVP
ncbi:MAG: hypothetical protein L3J74_12035 [Bacteroidales bacterium]|nr:hypothetical protein [Bacteroidales bacterium]